MIPAIRAAPKSGFHGVRLGCGDIHALKRCFILTISLSLYFADFQGILVRRGTSSCGLFHELRHKSSRLRHKPCRDVHA
jgi:hypothetical protein